MNTSDDKLRHGNPYRVPDGYFSELRNTLRERVAGETAAASSATLWGRVRGLAGFATAFGCLVLLAMTGFYFTGYRARQRELIAEQQNETSEMLAVYRLYTEDLEEFDSYFIETPADDGTGDEQRTLFAEAVTEYLDTYGYGGEGTELLAALTQGEAAE
ncbi:MAG: hypothetical protein K2G93_03705 [Rikenella sp.]|nr:hypothetical protein [Rikenella sp.]